MTIVKWTGNFAQVRIHGGVARGLKLAAEHVLEEANRIVPLDEGPLFESGATDVDPDASRASIFYDTPYACRQHEEMTWHHAPGRQAKYLETPANDPGTRKRCEAIIAREIRKAGGI
jgi:hypothetical protein